MLTFAAFILIVIAFVFWWIGVFSWNLRWWGASIACLVSALTCVIISAIFGI